MSDNIIHTLLANARDAAERVSTYTQKQIDAVCLSVGWQMYCDQNIQKLAESAVSETGMGNVADKITKHKVKVLGVLRDIQGAKSVGLLEWDQEKGIKKYAKPVGVVGVLTPVTNPTATPASNALSILKCRNAIIFAPHPRSKKSSTLAVHLMRQGLQRVGAPEDLIQIIEEPSLDRTRELMQQVDIILATGGKPMVKAAYSSGIPAYGVGPGNAVQMIAEDADVADAAAKITFSKAFDYATSCSSENSIIVHASIYDRMLQALSEEGAYLCSMEEKQRLQNIMWHSDKHGILRLNPNIIAQSAQKIAQYAGIDAGTDPRILMVEGQLPVEEDMFSDEKISPVLTIWKYHHFDEGLVLLQALTNYAGTGHSCGIHSHNQEYIERIAQEMKTSRIMIRQGQAPANGGNFYNGMPSTVTLGCGSWGGNITSENIYYKHFMNVTWVSEPIPVRKPSDEQIWGAFWEQFGI